MSAFVYYAVRGIARTLGYANAYLVVIRMVIHLGDNNPCTLAGLDALLAEGTEGKQA
jgi:hypothetical protein